MKRNRGLKFNSSRDLRITDEFSSALDRLEEGNGCLFITGKAGTGKSTLLRFFREYTKKQIAVVAPTGAAAINVQGETIHSFFKLPPRPIGPDDVPVLKENRMYRELDAIVIDEVSMVRADVMDGIDRFLRVNGRRPAKPFGGVQLILFGDLFQLPPVVASEDEAFFIQAHYGTPYFFNAHVFSRSAIETIELRRVFRQRENAFIEILNAVRNNELEARLLRQLNTRWQPDFNPPDDEPYITLTTTNRRAASINELNLKRLSGEAFTFEGLVEGDFDSRLLPVQQSLELKAGAQVMFVKNDPQHRWVNGTIGRVERLSKDDIHVKITEGGVRQAVDVEPVDWDLVKYNFNSETRRVEAEVVGRYSQFPIIPAYAITIHKSQGKTFDRAIIDLTGGAFAYGQAYVALSRCRTLEGIVLRRPLHPRDILVDRAILDFSTNPLEARSIPRLFQ